MTKYAELLRETKDERKDYLHDALDAVVTGARDHGVGNINKLASDWRLTSPEHDAIVEEARRRVSNESIDTCQTVIAAPVVVTQNPIDAKLTQEHTQITDDLEDLAAADLALESYRGLLDAAAKNGITRQSAMALKIGLQRIDRKLGIKSVSLESLDIGKRDMFQISLEDEQKLIGERKATLLEKGKALIKKLIEKAKELFERAKALVQGIPARVGRLKNATKHWAATAGRKIEVSQQPQVYLMKDGKPLGPSDAAALVKFIGTAFSAVESNLDAVLGGKELTALPEYSGPLPSAIGIAVGEGGYKIEHGESPSKPVRLSIRQASEVDRDLNALELVGKDLLGFTAERSAALLAKAATATTKTDVEEANASTVVNQIVSLDGLVRTAEKIVTAQLHRVVVENSVVGKPGAPAGAKPEEKEV